MKNKPCKELQAVGREHPASAASSEGRREVGPANNYCSKSSHKSQKPINTFTLKELWRRGKETHEKAGVATQNTGRNEELQQAGFLQKQARGTAYAPSHMQRQAQAVTVQLTPESLWPPTC